jgi:hypothetical protein
MMKIAITRIAHRNESVQENLNARVGAAVVVVMWLGVKQKAGA